MVNILPVRTKPESKDQLDAASREALKSVVNGNEDTQRNKYRIRRVGAAALTAVALAGGAYFANEALNSGERQPVAGDAEDDVRTLDVDLVVSEKPNGTMGYFDEEGEEWHPMSLKDGEALNSVLGGDMEETYRIQQVNGIEDPRELTPEDVIFVPSEVYEELTQPERANGS